MGQECKNFIRVCLRSSASDDECGPAGLAVAPDSTVYVADKWNHRIQRFSTVGQFLSAWGNQGSGDGQFGCVGTAPDLSCGPYGIAVAPDGTIDVADPDNNRIQRFSPTGQFLDKWTAGGSGIAVAPDGTLYMTGAYLQVYRSAYPTVWRSTYFANRWLAEPAVVITQTAEVNFDWGTGAPDSTLPADHFSARFQRFLPLPGGTYRFTVQTQGGVRLWVGDRLLVDRWDGPAGTYNGLFSTAPNTYPVQLEYNDLGGPSAVRLQWETIFLPNRMYLPLVRKGG